MMKDQHTKLFLILQCVLCFVLLNFFSSVVFPFTTDSLMHISTAQRILSLKGLTFANFYVLPPAPDFIPAILAPPGYPILIVLLKLAGINEYTASLFLPRMSFLLLPFLYFIVFRKLMPDPVAMTASFICTFMFSIIKCALIAWTDVPYLLVSLMSLAMAFQIIEKKGKAGRFFIFSAGLLVGYSYLLRYVGEVLMLSIIAGLVVSVLLRMMTVKDIIKTTGIYCLGSGLVIVPYWIRNAVVFSTIKQSMPLSQAPLTYTLHMYFQVLAEMIFINRSFDIIVLMLMAGFGICFTMYARKMIATDKERFVYAFILTVYFIIYSVGLIAFKANYLFCEGIDDRYLIQLEWIFMGGLIFGVSIILKRLNRLQPISVKVITGLLILLFILFQVFPAKEFYYDQKGMTDLSQKIEQYVPLLRGLPKDYVIVSNVGDITYYLSKRNVRWLSNYTPYGLLYYLGSKRRFAVFIVRGAPNLWMHGPDWRIPNGYYRGYSDKNVDLLLPLPNFHVQLSA
jgi:hypothetical protein